MIVPTRRLQRIRRPLVALAPLFSVRSRRSHTLTYQKINHKRPLPKTISPPFVIHQPSPPVAGTLFPPRAPTSKPNWFLLPRRPKRSDAAALACARYRLHKKGTLVDELRSLIHHCRHEVQAYNHLVTSFLINLRISLAENERILSLPHSESTVTPSPSTFHSFNEISYPYSSFHITDDAACKLWSAILANIPLKHRSVVAPSELITAIPPLFFSYTHSHIILPFGWWGAIGTSRIVYVNSVQLEGGRWFKKSYE